MPMPSISACRAAPHRHRLALNSGGYSETSARPFTGNFAAFERHNKRRNFNHPPGLRPRQYERLHVLQRQIDLLFEGLDGRNAGFGRRDRAPICPPVKTIPPLSLRLSDSRCWPAARSVSIRFLRSITGHL